MIAIVVAGRDAGVLELLDDIAREIIGRCAPNLTGGVEPNPVSKRFSCFVLAGVEGFGDKGEIDSPGPVQRQRERVGRILDWGGVELRIMSWLKIAVLVAASLRSS